MQQTDLFYWRHWSWHQMFMWASALLSLALLASAYAKLPGLNVFGHDEVHYYVDWTFKLVEEGRWLNFLLHNFLRSIPPGTWAVVVLITAWILFFRLSRSLKFAAPYAVLVASTVLLSSPFVEQSIWAATIMPAAAILLLAGILAERDVPYPRVYMASGILLIGSMQGFYFLMPLLFLGQFLDSTRSSKQQWLSLMQHLIWWVLGAMLGTLVVFTILWVKTGYFGVQPAAWRHTQPVHDIAGLIHNIEYVAKAFWQRTVHLLKDADVYNGWFILGLGFIAIVRRRALLASPHTFILIAAVAAGFFLFSIPLAPIIEQRSLQALGAAFVLFIAFLPGSSSLGRMTGAALLLTVGYGFSTHGESYLARHQAESNLFYYKLEQLMPGAAGSYATVALFGLMSDDEAAADIFNSTYKMHGIFHALGVERYRDCRNSVDMRCDIRVEGEPLNTLPLGRGQLVFFVNADNNALVQFRGTTAVQE